MYMQIEKYIRSTLTWTSLPKTDDSPRLCIPCDTAQHSIGGRNSVRLCIIMGL